VTKPVTRRASLFDPDEADATSSSPAQSATSSDRPAARFHAQATGLDRAGLFDGLDDNVSSSTPPPKPKAPSSASGYLFDTPNRTDTIDEQPTATSAKKTEVKTIPKSAVWSVTSPHAPVTSPSLAASCYNPVYLVDVTGHFLIVVLPSPTSPNQLRITACLPGAPPPLLLRNLFTSRESTPM